MARNVQIANAGGFTLLEIMITLTILGIVLAIGIPGMSSFIDVKRLVGATEQVYEHIQQARLESIARSVNFYANFNADGTATWQYGISATTSCDLAQDDRTGANACVMVVDDGDGTVHGVNGATDTGDLMLTRFTDEDYDGIKMSTSLPSGTQIDFEPLRGISSGGSVTLVSAAGKQLRVKVGVLGQIRICSPDGSVPGYSAASC